MNTKSNATDLLYIKLDPEHKNELRKAMLSRMRTLPNAKKPTGKEVTKDRTRLFFYTCALPFLMLLSSTRHPQNQEYCFIGSTPEHWGSVEARKTLLEGRVNRKLFLYRLRIFGCKSEERAASPFCYRFMPFLKWYFTFLRISTLLLFCRKKRGYFWLFGFFHSSLRLLTNKDLKEVYGYGVNPATYLTLTFAQNVLKIKPFFIMEELPLGYLSRRVHIDATLMLTLPVHIEEYHFYKKHKAIVPDSYEFCNLLEAECPEEMDLHKEKCDIGYFSSGLWLYADYDYLSMNDTEQVADIIRNLSTPQKKLEKLIAETLIDYAESNGLKLNIYLHPNERNMFIIHKIRHPYHELIKKPDLCKVIEDLSQKTSHAHLRLPSIAVTVNSTVIYKRMALGNHQCLCYDYAKYGRSVFNSYSWMPHKKTFGKYEAIFYKDENVLIEKLDEFFREGKPIIT